LEGLPYSRTGEQWRCEVTPDGDPGGGGDPDGVGGGVEPLLGDKELSFEEEREHLVSLLSSIVAKRRRREENPKQKVKECEMVISTRRRRYI
jgi:hypothetical protein